MPLLPLFISLHEALEYILCLLIDYHNNQTLSQCYCGRSQFLFEKMLPSKFFINLSNIYRNSKLRKILQVLYQLEFFGRQQKLTLVDLSKKGVYWTGFEQLRRKRSLNNSDSERTIIRTALGIFAAETNGHSIKGSISSNLSITSLTFKFQEESDMT